MAMKTIVFTTLLCLSLACCEKRDPPSAHNSPGPSDTQFVESFFQDYADAFRSQSKPRLLAKFCLPLTFLTKTGPIVFQDEEHLSANLEGLLRRYEQIQAVDFKHRIKEARPIGAGILLADLEWQFFDPRGELLYACDTTYLLATEVKPSAKVMAVIAHNEVERYEEALKRKTR
jgi:hypothetical protein